MCVLLKKTSSEDGLTTVPTLYYPDVRVINLVRDWKASGQVVYSACKTGSYDDLEFGEYFTEWRGGCLIRQVNAKLYNGNLSVHAATYWSSGTSYSQFEIVRWGTGDSFCVRRVGTACS